MPEITILEMNTLMPMCVSWSEDSNQQKKIVIFIDFVNDTIYSHDGSELNSPFSEAIIQIIKDKKKLALAQTVTEGMVADLNNQRIKILQKGKDARTY
jgi:hypothetical protein